MKTERWIVACLVSLWVGAVAGLVIADRAYMREVNALKSDAATLRARMGDEWVSVACPVCQDEHGHWRLGK